MAELADALDSKSSDRKVVEVQVLSPVLENAVLLAPRFFYSETTRPRKYRQTTQSVSTVPSAFCGPLDLLPR